MVGAWAPSIGMLRRAEVGLDNCAAVGMQGRAEAATEGCGGRGRTSATRQGGVALGFVSWAHRGWGGGLGEGRAEQ